MRVAGVAALIAVIAVLAAGTGTAATPKNGCGLLTKAEVVSALGEPLLKVEGGKSSTGAVYCNWFGKDDKLFSKGVTLTAAMDNVKQRYASYKSLMKKKTPLAGVGVEAVTDGTIILARSNRAMIQIGPMYANSGVTLATIKSLAKKSLARA